MSDHQKHVILLITSADCGHCISLLEDYQYQQAQNSPQLNNIPLNERSLFTFSWLQKQYQFQYLKRAHNQGKNYRLVHIHLCDLNARNQEWKTGDPNAKCDIFGQYTLTENGESVVYRQLKVDEIPDQLRRYLHWFPFHAIVRGDIWEACLKNELYPLYLYPQSGLALKDPDYHYSAHNIQILMSKYSINREQIAEVWFKAYKESFFPRYHLNEQGNLEISEESYQPEWLKVANPTPQSEVRKKYSQTLGPLHTLPSATIIPYNGYLRY